MALQLKQSLSLSQQLIMTPQLQQAIKLLQLSRLELLETITQEMETNPLLDEQSPGDIEGDNIEIVEEAISSPEEQPAKEVTIDENAANDTVDWETYISEYNTGWADTPYQAKEAPAFENMNQEKTSLNSHLMWQLSLSHLDDKQKEIGVQIIGNTDEDGYLQISIEELCEATGCTEEEVTYTLNAIQNFDPVGVCARDTKECLLIQARFQNLAGTIVEKIIMDHLDNLENKRYDKIARALSIGLPEVLKAVEITHQS
jgi:RNA polymerase sigma-54 factor